MKTEKKKKQKSRPGILYPRFFYNSISFNSKKIRNRTRRLESIVEMIKKDHISIGNKYIIYKLL